MADASMIFFHHPQNLGWFFLLAGLTGLLFFTRWRRKVELVRLAPWELLSGLVSREALVRRRRKEWIFLSGLALLIFASAGPQFGTKLKEVRTKGVDVFIAMDTSRSMLAEDIPPSRLARAKRSLGLLINKLQGNRVGIIAFAKFALVQCPLTIDTEAAKLFLDILNENSVPVQGTSLGGAIRLALKSFPEGEKGGKAIVLLTDGEDQDSDPEGALEEAKERGVVIYTIGIGTTEGDVIKKRDAQGRVTEFHKHNGEMVLSRLDDALLTKLARETGGQYYRASSTDQEIEDIAERLNSFDKRELAVQQHQRYVERYQWFLFIAFLLLLFEFFFGENPGQRGRIRRFLSQPRKPASVGLTLLLLTAPALARAGVKDHVLKGNKFVKQGKLEDARGEFKSAQIDRPGEAFLPYNIGNTYYLEGDFDQAKAYYDQAMELARDPAMKAKIAYNLGHVVFHMGNREEAVEHFKTSLRNDPTDLDAKYNIEYILAGKTPQNPPSQKNKEDQGKGGGSGEKGNQDESDQGENDGQRDGQDEQQKKDGLDKEEAEQILSLIEEQEKERRDQRPAGRIEKTEEKDAPSYADW